MSHRAYVAHRLPGRVRIAIPDAKRNKRAIQAIKDAVGPMPGIRAVIFNDVAGSVLIHYDPSRAAVFEDELRRQGADTGTFELELPEVGELDGPARDPEQDPESSADQSHVAGAIIRTVTNLNDEVRRSTGGAVDLKVLLPATFAFYSFLHRKSGRGTPLWLTLSLFSFNSFVGLHPRGPAGDGRRLAAAIEPPIAPEPAPEATRPRTRRPAPRTRKPTP
jgi:Heavy metal associated domain 2